MQNSRANFNITKPIFAALHIHGMRGDTACRFRGSALLPRIINAKLTGSTANVTPPPRLTKNKYYISQESIDFRSILSFAHLRAFRLTRSASAQAFLWHPSFLWEHFSDRLRL